MDIKKIMEMEAKRESSRLKALALLEKAEGESRFLTDDEKSEADKLETEIRNWDESIKRAKTVMSFEPQGIEEDRQKEEVEVKSVANDTAKGFGSLGDQLMAVYRSASPGGKLDNRLSTRSASGLNESNPSDGGFLVQKDFVKSLLKRTYETGILASKVKKIPLSSNSNGLKINSIDEDSRANGSRWGGVQTYWQNEADQIANSKPKFKQIDLSLNKLTGLCYATDELLADTSALESIIKEAFAEEFGFKIDDSILNGTGSGQPLGILKSSALVTVSKDSSQTE